MKKIKFIKSPLALGLGYSAGEEGTFETNQANELIELGLAEEVVKSIAEVSPEDEFPPIEKAVKPEPKNKEKAVK